MTDRTCSIEGCEGPHAARGWCKRHYYNWKRNGDPLAFKIKWDMTLGRTLEERFWSKVDKNGPVPTHAPELGPCWIWTASRSWHNRGRFGISRGVTRDAHAVAYGLVVGAVPEGLQLDHLCRNPPCCNPHHLEPVTGAENMRRFMESYTHCVRGHLYDEGNTRWYRGHKQCRACDRQAQAARRRDPKPGTRSVCITVKLSAADLPVIEAASGGEPKTTWMRAVALSAPPGVTAAPASGPRTIGVPVMVTEDEAALIDGLRGSVLRSPWMRAVALAAAA